MGPGNVLETNCAMVSLQDHVALDLCATLELMPVQHQNLAVQVDSMCSGLALKCHSFRPVSWPLQWFLYKKQ